MGELGWGEMVKGWLAGKWRLGEVQELSWGWLWRGLEERRVVKG